MVESPQELPGDTQAVVDGFDGYFPSERKFESGRPWEWQALYGEKRIVLAVRRRVARWGPTVATVAHGGRR
jgi:hypothetical protein